MWKPDLETLVETELRGMLGREPLTAEDMLRGLIDRLGTSEISPRMIGRALRRVNTVTEIDAGWVDKVALLAGITFTTQIDETMIKSRRVTEDTQIDLGVVSGPGLNAVVINGNQLGKQGFDVYANAKLWLADAEAGSHAGFTIKENRELHIRSVVTPAPTLESPPFGAFLAFASVISEKTGPGNLSSQILEMAHLPGLQTVWPPLTAMIDEAGLMYDADEIWPESMDIDAWFEAQALAAGEENDQSEDE